MKRILFLLIILIAGFAVYGSSGLAMHEWNVGNICPVSYTHLTLPTKA